MSKARGLADLGNVYNDGALSNRNVILNGAMQVAQRGTSVTNPQNYTLDRWKSLRYAANEYGVSQQDTGGLAGFSKCIRVQRTAGDTTTGNNTIALNQPVEQKSCDALIGNTATLSFWVRVGADFSADPAHFKSAIAYTTSTTDVGMYYDNFYSNGVATLQAIPISTSWTYVTMSVAIPSSAKQVGVAFTADYWSGTAGANAYFEVTGVQLEVGDTATPFEHRSYAQELALCQRYFWSDHVYAQGYQTGGSDYTEMVQHPVTMRANPSRSKVGVYDISYNAGPLIIASQPIGPGTNLTRFYARAGVTGEVEFSQGFTLDAEL